MFANNLQNIRINQLNNKVQVILDVDQLTTFQQFSLNNPPRVVIDIPHMKRLSNPGVSVNKGSLQSIRTGYKEDGTLRIVVDLRRVVKVNIYTLQPSDTRGNRIVLDIYDADDDPALTLTSLSGNQMPYVVFAGKSIDDGDFKVPQINFIPKLTSANNDTQTISVSRNISPSGAVQSEKKSKVPIVNSNKNIVICLDPGHGGKDPGAHSTVTGLKEKNAVLAISLKLKGIINKKSGYKVVMTRDKDIFIPLPDRPKKCRQAGGDLFISIHADAVKSQTPSGSSVYILSTHGASSQLAKYLANTENSVDLKWGVDVNKYDNDIQQALLNIQQEATLESSDIVASHTIKALGHVGNIHKSSVERANFVVLRSPEIPSMLVETAFISNPSEAKLLAKKSYQQKIAQGIAQGIENYFKEHLPQHLLLIN